MRAPDNPVLAKGDVLLAVDNVSLGFGGVKALTDVSFDIRKSEIRAIIGPNGAGKTSMLNCINGFYYPTEGRITFKGVKRPKMRPHEAARGGIARTFQNVALFKSMSTLDNIMAGRSIKAIVVPNCWFTSRMKRLISSFSSRFMPAMGSSSSSSSGSMARARPSSTRFCRP